MEVMVMPPKWARAYLELLARLVEEAGLLVDVDMVARDIIEKTEIEVSDDD